MDKGSSTDLDCDPLDVTRAAIVSTCTYHDPSWVRKMHYHRVHFRKVFFGQHNGKQPNIVMAHATDANAGSTLFIALPSTKSLKYWRDGSPVHQIGMGYLMGGVKGLFHRGFSRKLNEILPDIRQLAAYIEREKIRRVIFTGHSSGGSFAHMAFIKFMMITKFSGYSISIAFAPMPFCNTEAENFLLKLGLRQKMFTFYSKDDPVVYLLKNVDRSSTLALKYIVKSLMHWCLDPQNRYFTEQGEMHEGSVNEACSCRFFLSMCIAILGAKFSKPAGHNYVWVANIPTDIPGDDASVHATAASSIQSPELQEQRNDAELDIVQIIHPQIESCIMKFSGRHHARKEVRILVKGHNLSMVVNFRVKPILRGLKKGHWNDLTWSLHPVDCTDSKLCLQLKGEVDGKLLGLLTSKNWPDAAFSLSITTCFGKSRQVRVHAYNPWFNSHISCIISCCVVKILLMQSCDLPAPSSCTPEAISKLSGNANDEQKLLQNLHDAFKAVHLDHSVCFANSAIKQVIKSVDELVEQLLGSIKAKQHIVEKYYKRLGLMTPYHSYRISRVQSLSYRDCLVLLAHQLSSNHNQDVQQALHLLERQISDLVEKSNINEGLGGDIRGAELTLQDEKSDVDQLIKALLSKGEMIYGMFAAHKNLARVRTVVFVGPTFTGKTTLINCLLQNDVVGKGSSDVMEMAKSQSRSHENLILIDKSDLNEDETIATSSAGNTIKAYAIQKDNFSTGPIMLIEVKGNSMTQIEQGCQHLAHVADLAVVVVAFTDETAKEAKEFSEAVRQSGQCNNIVVVVNGIDMVLHGSEKSAVWKRYPTSTLDKLLKGYAHSANVDFDKVFMSVALAPDQLEDYTSAQLQDRGVLFPKDISNTLLNFIPQQAHGSIEHSW